jgi:histidyl-tRNA synthetase
MIKPQTLKGFRDFLPAEARKRQYVTEKLKTIFESFGFEPLETPSLEYEEVLTGKYGEEGDKLMYRFEDNGKRRVAMRYDQTVPLARVVAQYQNDLTVPFKRYQIQPVWRAENTQKGRYREFVQCDIDTTGLDTPLTDAEIIATAAKALKELGFNNFTILMNDRRVFSELVENGTVTEHEMAIAVIAVDKIKKIGEEGVINELIQKGITSDRAKEILSLIKNREKTDTLQDISDYLENQPTLKGKSKFDPTLARGLNYYTGLIFEIEAEGYPVGSICGGGRYDNLIGMFSGRQIPAVGCSFGFDRIIEAMEQLNLFPTELTNSVTKVLVTIFSEELKQNSQELANRLREMNINTELYLGEIKSKNPLEKQLKYADQKSIPYAIILGPEEVKENKFNLKNLQNRGQEQKTFKDLVEEIKE